MLTYAEVCRLVETMDEDKLTYVSKVWNCSVSHNPNDSTITRDQVSRPFDTLHYMLTH